MASNYDVTWQDIVDAFGDERTWPLIWKTITGFGGSKSKEATDELLSVYDEIYKKNHSSGVGIDTGSSVNISTGANDPGVDLSFQEFHSNFGSSASDNDNGIISYLEGLFSSVGAENEANRNYNSAQAQLQREWQSEENRLNREWQTEMANSAYQRAAADMKAAGLNPALAATGGSTSTPTGVVGAGNSASYQTGGGDTISSVLNAFSGIASAIADFLPANKVVQVIKRLGSSVK